MTTLLTLLSFLAVTPLELSVDFLSFLGVAIMLTLITSGQFNLALIRISNDAKVRFFGSFRLGTMAVTFLVIGAPFLVLL